MKRRKPNFKKGQNKRPPVKFKTINYTMPYTMHFETTTRVVSLQSVTTAIEPSNYPYRVVIRDEV